MGSKSSRAHQHPPPPILSRVTDFSLNNQSAEIEEELNLKLITCILQVIDVESYIMFLQNKNRSKKMFTATKLQTLFYTD